MPDPRRRKIIAYAAPLALFLGLQFLLPVIKIDNPELPWWRSAPEHWLYPLQAVLCLGVLIYFRKEYDFGKPRWIGLGVLFGLVGIGIWLLPVILGWQDRTDGGFDPTLFDRQTNPVGSYS
ncbi:MAG: hypothetical protein HKN23_05270, partial [Verrucomicrobiales bacterium]|nr:hypothetical protein [Verrucomicrobiales bacterium]